MNVTYDPIEQKKSHLDLLAIGYFILGGFSFLIPLFALLYVGLGAFMAMAPEEFGPDAPPEAVGFVMIGIGAFLIILGLAYAGLMIWTGLNLRRRKRPTACLVMGCITALNVPLGTILGVFTMVLLSQPEVKALFSAEGAASHGSDGGPPPTESPSVGI